MIFQNLKALLSSLAMWVKDYVMLFHFEVIVEETKSRKDQRINILTES